MDDILVCDSLAGATQCPPETRENRSRQYDESQALDPGGDVYKVLIEGPHVGQRQDEDS